MEYRLLGPLEVLDASGHKLPLGGARQQSVLASLLLRAGRTVALERLVDDLWEEPPATAARTVQVYVARLRHQLPEGAIESRAGGYTLLLNGDRLDLRAFEASIEEGRAALASGDHERAAQLLSEALSLWRGPALAGLGSEALRREAERLEELRLQVLEDRLEADLKRGSHREVVPELQALVAEQPFRERLQAQLMLALYRSGRAGEALEHYRQTRRLLVEELGMEPGEELRALERAILQSDPALVLSSVARSNLPVPPTRLIGREHEVEQANHLFSRDEVRLLTLTGPGGTGKTRLAIQLAAECLEEFPDGAFFVNLAPIADPKLVAPAIAKTLGVQEFPPRSLSDTLTDYLAGRRLLLLLDNFEHVPGAAPSLAVLLAAASKMKLLVTSRAPLHLAAEHEYPVPPLGLPDFEHLPNVAALSEYEAVALFVERARAVRPEFEVTNENARAVAEICVRLDGLPLAIELAAALVRALPPQALLQRLEQRLGLLTGGALDAPARQRTLRAAIDWSYALLGEAEQRLFTRLGTFAGGWDLEAAEAVCDVDDGLGVEVFYGISSLIEKSLVRAEDDRRGVPRYSMLESIREYANEKLEAGGEVEAVRRWHAEYFLALSERAERTMTGEEISLSDEPEERLWRELPNLRAALQWALDSHDLSLAVRLAASAWWAWFASGADAEGRAWVARVLNETEHLQTRDRARALSALAAFAFGEGDFREAEALLERALVAFRNQADRRWTLRTLLAIAQSAAARGDVERARTFLEEARLLVNQLGDDYLRGELWLVQGVVEGQSGNHRRAQALLEEGLAYWVELGVPRRRWLFHLINVGYTALQLHDFVRAKAALREYLAEDYSKNPVGIANAHGNLGLVALYEENRDEAEYRFRQSLALALQPGAKPIIAESLYGMAAVAAIDNDWERATRLGAAASAITEAIGTPLSSSEQFIIERYLEPAEAELRDDLRARARSGGGSMTIDEAVKHALVVPRVRLALDRSHTTRAENPGL